MGIKYYMNIGLVILFFLGVFSELFAGVPDQHSYVEVNGTRLFVQKRLEDGSLDTPKPYLIKGINWSPATNAPAEGVNPLIPLENTAYGFFLDWQERDPSGSKVLNYWLKKQYLD